MQTALLQVVHRETALTNACFFHCKCDGPWNSVKIKNNFESSLSRSFSSGFNYLISDLTIYYLITSWTPTLEVLSLIPRTYPPSYVDLSPRLVNPKPPHLHYKFNSSHRVWVGFWRLIVMPSYYFFMPMDTLSIHALELWLKASIMLKEGKSTWESFKMSRSTRVVSYPTFINTKSA